MRCFVGIPLPDDVRIALSQACGDIRASGARWRGEKWVPAENLHITLAFLGEVSEERIPELANALGEALDGVDSFELPFDGLHPAPNTRRTRMLWATYADPDGACSRLASCVASAAAACGIAAGEDRAFRAHVTLARARRPIPTQDDTIRALASAQHGVPQSVSVRASTLYASTLSRSGARYDILGSWAFHT